MVAGVSQIVIIWWEDLSGLHCEDSRLSLFCGWISQDCGERIIKKSLFCRRISLDCGGKISDCAFSVGGPLRIAGWGSTVRLWLIGGRISPDGGRRIYCKIVIIRLEYLSGLRWGSTVRLWLFGGRISPDCGVRIYCKIVIIRWEDLFGLLSEDLL